MSGGGDTETSVQVALRVRPQNSREQIDMCRVCTFCTPDQPHIVLGKDKAFTYDFVFDTDSEQEQIYNNCVETLVAGCFEGYNATVLAYGQTGSGKTYTMGTGFDVTVSSEQQGMIPQAVSQIFNTIAERRAIAIERNEAPPLFEVTTQFLELYNEDLVDLFDDSTRDVGRKLRIHEDSSGGIYIAGVTILKVESEEETLACLKRGALSRTVGSTNMNAQSSRSHAIFTLSISQQRSCNDAPSEEGVAPPSNGQVADWESLTAKFHFVDLAGSERLKRTGATGDRAKEGISINCGLLALGNVISALGDNAKKGSHVPYRDSKLTRLLQDSLGGNSRTLMVACISPADRDFMETLNTLKYANRARNIKNKVMVNQDKASQQLTALRARIQKLEVELQEFRSGRKVVSEDGSVVMNDMANEITMLRTENDKLRVRVKAMQLVIDSQSGRIAALTADREAAALGHHDESTGQVVPGSIEEEREQQLSKVIQGYMKEIEDLKSRLVMSESLAHQSPGSPFRRAPSSVSTARLGSASTVVPFDHATDDLLQHARDDIQRLREREERKVTASASEMSSTSRHRRRPGSSAESTAPPYLISRMLSDESEVHEKAPPLAVFSFEEDSNSSNEDDSDEDDDLPKSDSSDDSDDADETGSLASSVAELSSEINLKQQLVDQLEKAQKNLLTMRDQYEDKMTLLQQQIRSTEAERDKVLKEMTSRREMEKVKEIKGSYEKQLVSLRTELKSLKTARKEHAKAMRKNAQYEKELQRLKGDVLEMKKQRVRLLTRMRTDASQKKIDVARKAHEICQLRKESRKKEHKIKSLEADVRKREIVLRRREGELKVFRQRTRYHPPAQPQTHPLQTSASVITTITEPAAITKDHLRPLSTQAPSGSGHLSLQAPSGGGKLSRRQSSVFSSDNARKKWREMERKIMDTVMRRQTMSTLAKDMDRWIEKRDELSRRREDLVKQREATIKAQVDVEELSSIDEDLDSNAAHIDYVQENIQELQSELIAVDDSKTDSDTMEAHSIITSCSPREAKYLLEHLLDMVLTIGVKAEQKEAEARSLRARLQTSEETAELMKTFSSPQVSYPIVVNLKTVTMKTNRTITKVKKGAHNHELPPPPPLNLDSESEPLATIDSDDGRQSDSSSDSSQLHEQQQQQKQQPKQQQPDLSKCRRRTALPSELVATRLRQFSDPPTSGNQRSESADLEAPDGGSSSGNRTPSPRVRRDSAGPFEAKRKGLKKRATTSSALDLPSTASCPSSPGTTHRLLLRSEKSESNVWARLSGGTANGASADFSKGSLQAERPESRRNSGRLLTCTHTACGHSASVLSVCATQNLLFSASQDRTVKVWDLRSGSEMLTLDKHFSYVRCVRYCPKSRLIFTASQSLIKIWDMRNYRAKCIKTFGPPNATGHSSSDTVVQDLFVSSSRDTLFSASGNFVNLWDLKKFMHSGRLVGHNGAVCTLTMRGNLMATGSRDRLIKLYDLEGGGIGASQSPLCTLYPPHYDAVTSFAVYKDTLFSACGVTIKQWDIKEHSLKQAVDGAHPQGNLINSLGTLPSPFTPLLVSGCKGGLLKLWNPETCTSIGEVVAHKTSINCISTNDTCIFTGSSDKTIRIWRISPSHDS